MPHGFWHFRCPECGIGDCELGYLAGDQDLHCEVCLEEESRLVRLHRWLAAEQPDYARLRPSLAA